LRFAGKAGAVAQIITAAFDISEHAGLDAAKGRLAFEFAVDSRQAHYLRLQTVQPVALLELKIDGVP
jgi:hypothetical protein